MKAVAYMLDTDAWKNFTGDKAEYAVGAPTLEMFIKSYKQIRPASKIEYKVENYGYKCRKSDNDDWMGDLANFFETYDNLYCIAETSKCESMWFASPSASTQISVFTVDYEGFLSDTGELSRFPPCSLLKV